MTTINLLSSRPTPSFAAPAQPVYEPAPNASSALVRSLTATQAEAINEALSNSLSENSRRSYASCLRQFTAWCLMQEGIDTDDKATMFSPLVVTTYLVMLSGHASPKTVEVARAAILNAAGPYKAALSASEPLKQALRGCRRAARGYVASKAPALSREDILKAAQAVAVLSTVAAARDHAIYTLGLSGALRSSDLVNLIWSDVTFVEEGIELRIRFSKSSLNECTLPIASLSETAQNQVLSAVKSVKKYMHLVEVFEGKQADDSPLFRSVRKGGYALGGALSPSAITPILRNLLRAGGVENPEQYSSHSLRSTAATTASRQGFSLDSIMRLARWETPSVALGYFRHEKWENPASAWLGAE